MALPTGLERTSSWWSFCSSTASPCPTSTILAAPFNPFFCSLSTRNSPRNARSSAMQNVKGFTLLRGSPASSSSGPSDGDNRRPMCPHGVHLPEMTRFLVHYDQKPMACLPF